jgi:glycogen operon protein
VLALRGRQSRNLLATLLLSQGVPMVLAGDEIGRTQQGNNNAYCQDNATSWLDWNLDDERRQLLEFVQRVVSIRREHPVFHRSHFFQGKSLRGGQARDIAWLKPDGTEMTENEWEQEFARSLGVYLGGDALDEVDSRGRLVRDDNFLMLFNAHHEEVPFTLPDFGDRAWRVVMDTARHPLDVDGVLRARDVYTLQGRSFALLQERRERRAGPRP